MEWKYIGEGDEATCYLGEFIKSSWVKRENHTKKGGNGIFLKHRAAKALDEYFLTKGEYSISHIPKPMLHFYSGYYYHYVEGSEAFPWEFAGEPCELGERRVFDNLFLNAGFSMGYDIADANDGRVGKNIVLRSWSPSEPPNLSKHWMRIDFGNRSLPFNEESFRRFLKQNRDDLESVIGYKVDHLVAFLSSLRE